MTESPGFLTIDRIRQAEARALANAAPGALMRQAATAVTQLADQLLQRQSGPAPVIALVGPGNNGADALLSLMMLAQSGYAGRAFALEPQSELPPDASHVHREWLGKGGLFHPLSTLPDHFPALSQRSGRRDGGLIIDGLFGIGLHKPLQGDAAAAAQLTHRLDSPVVAVDVPSGLNAATGAIVGGDRAAAVRASHTVTMIGNKAGLHTGAGKALAGQVQLASLGLDCGTPDGLLLERAWVNARLTPRGRNTHKGSYGSVGILGGAPSMPGAALLAGNGARCAGAGKVALISPGRPVFDSGSAQLMAWSVNHPDELLQQLDGLNSVVAGCGLGTGEAVRALLTTALSSPVPAVIDADGLNMIAADQQAPALRLALSDRADRWPTVLTPHPLEAARLLGQTVAQVQNDRIAAALSLAALTHCTVVLKGAGSIIAAPDGRQAINSSGGPALATGGTGDILAGVIGGLLAQGHTGWEAAAIGVWVHGRAGDQWTDQNPRATGLDTRQLLHELVSVFNTC